MQAVLNSKIVEERDGELVVSHRTIAEYAGVEQRALDQLARKYNSDFEEFGQVVSEIREDRSKTIWLNEKQAMLMLAFMKNSEKAREAKLAIVKEFYRMREYIQKKDAHIDNPLVAQAMALVEQAQKLANIEIRLDLLEERSETAKEYLLALPSSTVEPPEKSDRALLNQKVRRYATANNISPQNVWRRLYEELYYRYHVNLRAVKRSPTSNLLDVAEKKGYLPQLLAIADYEFSVDE